MKVQLSDSLDDIRQVGVKPYLPYEVVQLKQWTLPEMKKLQDKDSSLQQET